MYNHNNSSNMIDSLMFALNGSSKADGLYEAHDGQGDLKICVACTWCGAPWTLLSLVRFQPFSRGHAMWCTCRSDISSSCSLTARSLIGTDVQAWLGYFAFLRRNCVCSRMTALNVRSNFICAGDSLHTRVIVSFSSCGQLRRGSVIF